MSVAITKAGPYYASGSISFSSLRTNFKESGSGSISASELRRNTTTSDTNPIVPDATENSSVSTNSNLAISQFRNTIKYYYITQTAIDLNFNIGAQSWNSNLNKNIRKWAYINGTCGSNSSSSPASTFATTVHNLTIDVSGIIYGAGGSGGTGFLYFNRYYNSSGLHFYTANPTIENLNEDGYFIEVTNYFGAYSYQLFGTVPLYRLFDPTNGSHILTTNQTEYDNGIVLGLTDEGIVGYVYDTPNATNNPVYRLYLSISGDYFYTTSSAERDLSVSRDGYVYQSQYLFYTPINVKSGGDGGTALSITNSSGSNLVANIQSTAKIYGAGGGGGQGQRGEDGSPGTCILKTTTQGCGFRPGCPSGYTQTGTSNGRCCQTYLYCCGLFNCGCVGCASVIEYRFCRRKYAVSGGIGGQGGDGGPGRGYNNLTGSLSGSAGSPGGANNGCGSTNGNTGETGGNGGDWASAGGGNSTNTGNGGSAGKAINGSNYTITGIINSSTIRGLYLPQ